MSARWLLGAAVVASMLVVLVGLGAMSLQRPGGLCQLDGELVDPIGMSARGQAAIPSRLRPLYVQAAQRFSLGADGWLWLAAINRVETEFGANTNTSSAGAQGPMQFMPATWASFGIDADHDGNKDITSAADAIFGAANYLHASGAPRDWHRAVFAYNHAEWYYQRVLGFVSAYRATDQPDTPQPQDPRRAMVSLPAKPADGGEQARRIAKAREGQLAYALADRSGRILASYQGNTPFPGVSLSKAMLLVAQLRKLGPRPVPAGLQPVLRAMVTQSQNAAANTIYRQVGRRRLNDLARAAGIRHLRLTTTDRVYRLGDSQLTAIDQARFFAQIDQLMPATSRGYGMSLLHQISPDQQWGFWQAGLPSPLYAKAGWKPSPTGYIVNQAAQIHRDRQIVGLAVLSNSPTQAYGQHTMKLLAAELAGSSQDIADPAPGSGCAPEDRLADPGGAVTLTPGQRARLLPNGQAAAPQEAPAQVKAMIAAGNRIVGKPYSQGAPHGTPYTTVLDHYDCSSSVAFILFHAGLIKTATENWVSGSFASTFGTHGDGQWVTLRANRGHIYMYVAGLRWDTHRYGAADRGDPGIGWHTAQRPDGAAFTAKHPQGL